MWDRELWFAVQRRDGAEGARIIEAIILRFDDDLTVAEIDTEIYNLFVEKPHKSLSLINFVRAAFADSSFASAVCKAFLLLSKLLNSSYKLKFNNYVKDISSMCVNILCSACTAKVKEKCFLPLNSIINGQWQECVPPVIDVLIKHLLKKNEKPTVLAKEYELIGVISHFYPELIGDKAETINKIYLQEIESCVSGKVKISFLIVEGCFKGLNLFWDHFFDPHMVDIIYKGVKEFSDPGDQSRRMHARACLHIIAKHGHHLSKKFLDDYKYWHLLLTKWLNQSNPDDKKAGYAALFSFYKNLAESLENLNDRHCFNYFMDYFKNILAVKFNDNLNSSTDSYEIKYALKGFTTFVSNCNEVFNAVDFQGISQSITQRALLIYKDKDGKDSSLLMNANEKTTENIEELCNYMDALTAMKINIDHDLDTLTCILISDFPKCLPHRRFIIFNSIKKVLEITNIQIVITHFLKESCKYCVSDLLYYNLSEQNNVSSPLSYITFVPLWQNIIEIRKDSLNIPERVYDIFMSIILDTLPKLDLTTKNIPKTSFHHNEENNTDLESFAIPVFPSDYRYFTNACDLTATILNFGWTSEWFMNWVDPFLAMLLNGRKRYPNVVGFLRILEAAFKAIKDNDAFQSDVYRNNIINLINTLDLVNTSGLLQLRTALVFLRISPDTLPLRDASKAIEVILLYGKSNLNIVNDVLEMLEEWNSQLERHKISPLFQEILPLLNEYLCSTGISDVNIIEDNNSQKNYNKKKNAFNCAISPQLASLQRKIMLFFGKMDSTSIKQLISLESYKENLYDDEVKNVLYMVENLKISFPCPELQKLNVNLDLLYPRITELALHSTNRNTRIVACQALHSIIILMYGTGLTLPQSQKMSLAQMHLDLYKALIYLVADSDSAISTMFTPLLKQTCHWFSLPQYSQSNEANWFLSVLLKSASNTTNGLVSDLACQALKEYIVWHLTKCSVDQLNELPLNISAILRAVIQMIMHPNGNERHAGYLIFNCIIHEVYNLDSVINKFLLEFLYSIVKSIEKTMGELSNISFICNDIHIELGMKALNNALKCLEKKIYLFQTASAVRRIPSEFGRGLLEDIARWLLSQAKCNCQQVTKMCFYYFAKIKKSSNNSTFDTLDLEQFLIANIEWIGSDNLVSTLDCSNLIENLYSFFRSLDNYIYVLKYSMFDTDKLNYSSIFTATNLFFKLFNEMLIDNNFRCDSSSSISIEIKIFQTMWKLYEFMNVIAKFESRILSFIETVAEDFGFSLTWIFNRQSLAAFHQNNNYIDKKHIKNIIIFIKDSLPIQWTMIRNIFTECLKQSFLKNIFNNETLSSPPETRVFLASLDFIGEIIKLFDVDKATFEEFGFSKKISHIFNNLLQCNEENTLRIVVLDSSQMNMLNNFMNFILKLDCVEPVKVLEILSDQRTISNIHFDLTISDEQLSYGKYCLYKFEEPIMLYILKNIRSFLDCFKIYMTRTNKDWYTHIIEKFLTWISKSNKNYFCDPFVILESLCNIWPIFIELGVLFEELIKIYALFAYITPSPLQCIGLEKNNLNVWLIDSFSRKESTIENKIRIIALLPTVLKSGVGTFWFSESIRNGLNEIQDNFPISCHEFKQGSKRQSVYLNILKNILDSIVNSGCYILLDFLIKTSIVDEHHICEEQIHYKIESLMRGLNDDDQLSILLEVSKMITDSNLDALLLLNLLNRFLVVLLQSSSPLTTEEYFIKFAPAIFNMMKKEINISFSNYQMDRVLVEWICCFKLFEIMFVKINFVNIDSVDSKIALNVYKEPPVSRKFVKDIYSKAFNLRKIEIQKGNLSNCTIEFLRLSRCAAYKCLYAITVSRPRSEFKFYEPLLMHKVGSTNMIWDGMISADRNYSFPIKSLTNDRNIQHLVPTKQSMLLFTQRMDDFEQSYKTLCSVNISTTEKNKSDLLHATLVTDAFKFDLNAAFIRDSYPTTLPDSQLNKNSHVKHSSIILNDDNLNNHEIMATVCQLIHDIYKISTSEYDPNISLSSTASSSQMLGHENNVGWIKYITNILIDQTKSKNIRLFLAQVVDNTRSVFKHFSKMLFLPILSVIQDRCTSYSSEINYVDVCLISLLLSWNVLPDSEDEITSLSAVIKFIICETDPSQGVEIYKHCLELVKETLSLWGKYIIIPFELIIDKLQNKNESRKSVIQIICEILKVNCKPWNNVTFNTFYENIIDCFLSEDKDVFKPTSEVIGVMMKILLMDNEENTIDESERLQYIDKIEKKLISMFTEKKYEKYILSLRNIQENCFVFCNETFLSKVIFLVEKLPADQKKICLGIFLKSMHVLESDLLYKELASMNIENLIKDKRFQSLILNIINKALDSLSFSQVNLLYKDFTYICELTNINETECRVIVYDILMKLYLLYQEHINKNIHSDESRQSPSCFSQYEETIRKETFINDLLGDNCMKNFRAVKYALINGLDDNDTQLRSKVVEFWDNQFPKNLHNRWLYVLNTFLIGSYGDALLLNKLLRIILHACCNTPDFKITKIFENPLEECIYKIYDWKENLNKKSHSIAPMFAETLNSQLLISNILQQNERRKLTNSHDIQRLQSVLNISQKPFAGLQERYIKNTLESLKDTIGLSFSSFNDSFSDFSRQSLYNSTSNESLQNSLETSTSSSELRWNNDESSIFKKLRKKFSTNKKQDIIKFTGINAKRQSQKERRRLVKKEIESLKQFKDGDYPDIQIYLPEIITPLLELTMCDVILARELFIIIFKSISDHIEQFYQTNPNNSREKLKSFQHHSSLSILNFLKFQAAQTPLSLALLQVCRLSLYNCYEISGFDMIIGESAKQCGIEWLGKLIIEEKKIYCLDDTGERPTKRLKIVHEDINEEKIKKYNDNIYNLSITGKWDEVQTLLNTYATDDELSDEIRLRYTEDYFISFSKLSNWEDFIQQIKFQLSPQEEGTIENMPFYFDNLWKKTWIKNTILPLTFDALIHRFRSLITVDGNKFIEQNDEDIIKNLDEFENSINVWLDDTTKAKFLNSFVSTNLAVWKSVIQSDHSSIKFINSALEYLRDKWMELNSSNRIYEFDFRCDKQLILNKIQMIAEIGNLFECPLFNSSFNGLNIDNIYLFKKMLNNWKYCVPEDNDNVVYWDIRLACRCILAVKIQKLMKPFILNPQNNDDESSNIIQILSKAHQYSEINLVKLALQYSNVCFAEKYITNNLKYVQDEESISWGLQWTKTCELKAEYEIDIKKKINAYFKAWKIGEEIRLAFNLDDDPFSYSNLLINAAYSALNVCLLLHKKEDNFDIINNIVEYNESIIQIIVNGKLFKENIAENLCDSTKNISTLLKYGKFYLQESINIAERNEMKFNNNLIYCYKNKPEEVLSNAYLIMYKYCRKISSDIGNCIDFDSTSDVVRNLLRALKLGNVESRKMFPILLIILEKLPKEHDAIQIFNSEISNVPTYYFIPWVSQILAHLPTLKDILLHLVLKIANEYPQSVLHHYRSSKRIWKMNKSENMANLITQLDSKLLNHQIETLIAALGSLCDPYVLLETHLKNLLYSTNNDDKDKWDSAFTEFFEEMFPEQNFYNAKLRGPIFKELTPYKAIFEKYFRDGMNISIEKSRQQLLQYLAKNNFQEKYVQSKFRSISDFSPYLSTYGDVNISDVFVFGQYGNFENVLPRNNVSIVKFENEVTVINSLRRPILITLIGSDGKRYKFLVKRGEDLKQDERIQQLFSLMNSCLLNEESYIQTYKVIPLSWDLGLIQWLLNGSTLKELLIKYNDKTQEILLNVQQEQKDYVLNNPGKTWGEKYGIMAMHLEESKKVYYSCLNKIPKYLLRECLCKLSVSPDTFVFMKNNYIKSLAPLSISHWILGIGDRHLSNCLISLETGGLIGIDFGYAFGTATQLLDVPELIPFRLTPQLLNVITSQASKGHFRQLMINSLERFKENSSLLMAVMEVFVFEPAMNWIKNVHTEDSFQTKDNTLCQWSPQIKIRQCKRKLTGVLPMNITLEDLRIRSSNNNFIEHFCAAVILSCSEVMRKRESLTTAEQVDCLINQAMDDRLLAVTYFGWEPWL